MRWMLRHPIATAASIESSALVISAATFVVAGLFGLLAFRTEVVPIAGPDSVGQYVAVVSFFVGVVVFVGARILVQRRSASGSAPQAAHPELRWFDIAALALAHGIIALLGWLATAALLAQSFVGAVLYPFSAAVLAGVAVAVASYAVYLSAVHLGPMQLSLVLVVFLAFGVFTSMLTATDPLWWQKNLSTLGISDDLSAKAFNITLIIAGVIITTIAHYAAAQVGAAPDPSARGRRTVGGALSLIGVLLALVGIFPVDEFWTVHNLTAVGMVVVYVVLVLSLKRLLPTLPQTFILLGYVFVGVVVVLAVLFATQYYTLTAVELVAFVMIFSWLIVFLRTIGAQGSSEPRDADVEGR